jgi:hypothetical protein
VEGGGYGSVRFVFFRRVLAEYVCVFRYDIWKERKRERLGLGLGWDWDGIGLLIAVRVVYWGFFFPLLFF